MAAPTRELEKLILSRRLAHGGNPVTRWMASNAAVSQDPAGNLKPLAVGSETFVIQGEPERRDPNRFVWMLDVRLA